MRGQWYGRTVRKKVAISKARVLKAKDALEKVNQSGKGPRLGAAVPGVGDARHVTPRAGKKAD